MEEFDVGPASSGSTVGFKDEAERQNCSFTPVGRLRHGTEAYGSSSGVTRKCRTLPVPRGIHRAVPAATSVPARLPHRAHCACSSVTLFLLAVLLAGAAPAKVVN